MVSGRSELSAWQTIFRTSKTNYEKVIAQFYRGISPEQAVCKMQRKAKHLKAAEVQVKIGNQ